MRRRPTTSPEVVAIHEAAHAVVARVLGLRGGRAYLLDDGTGLAHVTPPDPSSIRGVRKWLAVSMAGAAAERLLLGITGPNGDITDKQGQLDAAERLGLLDQLDGLQAWAERLVTRHAETIRTVASELLQDGELGGRTIDRLVTEQRLGWCGDRP